MVKGPAELVQTSQAVTQGQHQAVAVLVGFGISAFSALVHLPIRERPMLAQPA